MPAAAPATLLASATTSTLPIQDSATIQAGLGIIRGEHYAIIFISRQILVDLEGPQSIIMFAEQLAQAAENKPCAIVLHGRTVKRTAYLGLLIAALKLLRKTVVVRALLLFKATRFERLKLVAMRAMGSLGLPEVTQTVSTVAMTAVILGIEEVAISERLAPSESIAKSNSLADGAERTIRQVKLLVDEIIQRGTLTQGIFRLTRDPDVIRELSERIMGDDSQFAINFSRFDPIDLASTLKAILRLAGPLFPRSALLAVEAQTEPSARFAVLGDLIANLPHLARVIFEQMIRVSRAVAAQASVNLMGASNLAICLAPNLVRSEDLLEEARLVRLTTSLLKSLIEHGQTQ